MKTVDIQGIKNRCLTLSRHKCQKQPSHILQRQWWWHTGTQACEFDVKKAPKWNQINRTKLNYAKCDILPYGKKKNTISVTNIHIKPTRQALHGKAVSITYSECASVALGIQHAKRMRSCYIVICGLSDTYNFFSHYLVHGKIFFKKNHRT